MYVPISLTGDVYHYTSADVAIYNILAQGEIRLGLYESTNDPLESQRKVPSISGNIDDESATSLIWDQADRWLRRFVKLACFTQDFRLPSNVDDSEALRGWAHHSLWAHYGGGHSGVCLRFNRDKLIEQFHLQLSSEGQCFHGPVQYPVQRFTAAPIYPLQAEQIYEFGLDAFIYQYINDNYRELFFTKSNDWGNEKEFRIVLNSPSPLPDYVNFRDALTGVVLGLKFSDAKLWAVQRVLSGVPGVELLRLMNANGRIICVPAPSIKETEPITHRRSGSLEERVSALRSAEQQSVAADEKWRKSSASTLKKFNNYLSTIKDDCSAWGGVEITTTQQRLAVPPEHRKQAPGIAGEGVEFERGWNCIVENLPKQSFTLVTGLAFQGIEGDKVKLYGLIEIETWSATDGREIAKHWAHECVSSAGAVEISADALIEKMKIDLDKAMHKFNELTGRG